MSQEASKEFAEISLPTFGCKLLLSTLYFVLVHQAHHRSDGDENLRVQLYNCPRFNGFAFILPVLLFLVVRRSARSALLGWQFRRSFAANPSGASPIRRTSRSRRSAAAERGKTSSTRRQTSATLSSGESDTTSVTVHRTTVPSADQRAAARSRCDIHCRLRVCSAPVWHQHGTIERRTRPVICTAQLRRFDTRVTIDEWIEPRHRHQPAAVAEPRLRSRRPRSSGQMGKHPDRYDATPRSCCGRRSWHQSDGDQSNSAPLRLTVDADLWG